MKRLLLYDLDTKLFLDGVNPDLFPTDAPRTSANESARAPLAGNAARPPFPQLRRSAVRAGAEPRSLNPEMASLQISGEPTSMRFTQVVNRSQVDLFQPIAHDRFERARQRRREQVLTQMDEEEIQALRRYVRHGRGRIT